MLTKFRLLLILMIAFVPLACDGGSGLDLKEGRWEMTVEMNIPGMPKPMKPMTMEECLTVENAVPNQNDTRSGCEMISTKIDGNTVSWETKCNSANGGGTSSGEITYNYDSFEGFMTMDVQGKTMKNTMKGKWIGSCD